MYENNETGQRSSPERSPKKEGKVAHHQNQNEVI